MTTQQVIGILIPLTAISSYINYRFTKLPKSIGITLITLTLSLLVAVGGRLGWDVDDFAQNLLDGIGFNETFLHGMLSFLLFAGSLHVNAMELAKYKSVVALLATVSVVISTCLVGYAMYGLTKFLNIDMPFYYCFVFGALISPTDPIAVMGVLRTANAPKSLEVKIAGEALFNDGMGIVLFFVALGIASGAQEALSAKTVSLYFVRQGIGGLLLGCTIGWLAARLLRSIDDYEVAVILTLAIVTGGYTLAHSIADVSGPICMAIAGLIIGGSLKDGNMSKTTMHRLDSFWELLDEVLNAILFVVIGLEFLRISFSWDTTVAAIGAIVIVIIARWISVIVPVACLSRFRKFNLNVLLIMTWGGLRGGISIALALSIQYSHQYDFIVAITYAVVLFSMMVQGVTIGPLIRRMRKSSDPKYIEEELPGVG
jgi:CPA1 family monovalent cation:H+ antiporter